MDTERLIEILTAAGVIPPDEPWTVTPAAGGLNTTVYRASRPGEDAGLSIRVFEEPANLEREVAAIEEVAACPGVPRLRYAGEGILVHDYLTGKPRPLQDVDEASIRRLCQSLRCIHAVRHDFYTLWSSPATHRGSRRDLFRARCAGLEIHPDFQATGPHEVRRVASTTGWLDSRPLEGGGWLDTSFSRLHGDLSHGNILWADGAVGLIDWEFTRIGDPAEELAYLITDQLIDDDRVQLIGESYIGAGGEPDTWRRVPCYAVFTALDSALWWVDYLLRHRENPAGHPEVEMRLAVAERWIASIEARER